MSAFVKRQSTPAALTIPFRPRPECIIDKLEHRRFRSLRAKRCLLPTISPSSQEDIKSGILQEILAGWLVSAARCPSQHEGTRNRSNCAWQKGNVWRGSRSFASIETGSRRRFATQLHKRNPAAAPAVQEDADSRAPFTREEYKDLVNIYGTPPDELDHRARLKLFPLAPRLVLPPEKEDPRPRLVLEPEDRQSKEDLRVFTSLLIREVGTVAQSTLWRAFERIPRPQTRYVDDEDINKFFRHMSWVEYKNAGGNKERVFALLNQCVEEKIPLAIDSWTTAITFAGRGERSVGTDQVRSAIETWMRMEDSGISAAAITFNVLFDIAVKAGRFALADTIQAELNLRGMRLDRNFRCSMIYQGGVRGDGDAVRFAFNDFVNAGEFVDTAVMNCVIRSLIHAGEGPAAEHVFLKMKALHEERFPSLPPNNWLDRRKLGKLLNKTAATMRARREEHEASFFGARYSDKDQFEEIQRTSPIAPDALTYRLLIGHHALVSGDLDRLMELLGEMKEKGFRVHGSVYDKVFHGFNLHGSEPHSAWGPRALEGFWREFTETLPEHAWDDDRGGHPLEPGPHGFLSSLSADPHGLYQAYGDDVDFDCGPPPSDSELSTALDTVADIADGIHRLSRALDGDFSEPSEENRPYYIGLPLAKKVVKAYYRCCGKERMLQVRDEIVTLAGWSNTEAHDRRCLDKLVNDMVMYGVWR